MTNEGFMIVPDSASLEGGALTYAIRLPWYRSLPLSAVETLEVRVDGEEIPAQDVRIHINDVDRTPEELRHLWDEMWFVQDQARIRIPDAGPTSGSRTITTHVALRSPYILIGPEHPLVTHSTVTHTFTLEGQRQ